MRRLRDLGPQQHETIAGYSEPVRSAGWDQEDIARVKRPCRPAIDPAPLDQSGIARHRIDEPAP